MFRLWICKKDLMIRVLDSLWGGGLGLCRCVELAEESSMRVLLARLGHHMEGVRATNSNRVGWEFVQK